MNIKYSRRLCTQAYDLICQHDKLPLVIIIIIIIYYYYYYFFFGWRGGGGRNIGVMLDCNLTMSHQISSIC